MATLFQVLGPRRNNGAGVQQRRRQEIRPLIRANTRPAAANGRSGGLWAFQFLLNIIILTGAILGTIAFTRAFPVSDGGMDSITNTTTNLTHVENDINTLQMNVSDIDMRVTLEETKSDTLMMQDLMFTNDIITLTSNVTTLGAKTLQNMMDILTNTNGLSQEVLDRIAGDDALGQQLLNLTIKDMALMTKDAMQDIEIAAIVAIGDMLVNDTMDLNTTVLMALMDAMSLEARMTAEEGKSMTLMTDVMTLQTNGLTTLNSMFLTGTNVDINVAGDLVQTFGASSITLSLDITNADGNLVLTPTPAGVQIDLPGLVNISAIDAKATQNMMDIDALQTDTLQTINTVVTPSPTNNVDLTGGLGVSHTNSPTGVVFALDVESSDSSITITPSPTPGRLDFTTTVDLEPRVSTNENNITSLDARVTILEQEVVDAFTVYANAGTGNDMNDGLTSGTAVQTITKAIDLLGRVAPKAKLCTIQLEGSTVFNLGNDPVLCFYPAAVNCKHTIVQGIRDDAVTGVMASNPSGTAFNRVSMATHTLTSPVLTTDYSTYFAENLNTNNIVVVDQTPSTTTFIPLAPVGFSTVELDNFPFNVSDAFLLGRYFSTGNSVQFFKVGTTTITWTRELILDIGSNEISFQAILFDVTSIASSIIAPDDMTHRVRLSGCLIETNAAAGFPIVRGSMIWQGVTVKNTGFGVGYLGHEGTSSTCIVMDSVYIIDMSMLMSSCPVTNSHFKSNEFGSTRSTVTQLESVYVNFWNVLFESVALIFASPGNALFRLTEIYGEYALPNIITATNGANVHFQLLSVAINQTNSAVANPVFTLTNGAHVTLTTETGTPWSGIEQMAVVEQKANMIVLRFPAITAIPSTTPFPLPLVEVRSGGALYINMNPTNFPNTIVNPNNASIVEVKQGGTLDLLVEGVPNNLVTLSTPPGTPLFDAREDGARINARVGTITNAGGTLTDVLYCGNTVMDPYTASVSTAFTICTR